MKKSSDNKLAKILLITLLSCSALFVWNTMLIQNKSTNLTVNAEGNELPFVPISYDDVSKPPVSEESDLQKHTVNITGEHCTVIIKDESGVVIDNGSEVPEGTTITYEAVADQGYYIGTGGTKYKTETITVNGDIDKTLSMGIIYYRVSAITYDSDKYCVSSPTVSGSGIVPYGGEVTFTASAPKTDYEFIGWYYSNGKLVSAEYVVKMKITSTTSLYARYRKTSGVVTFMSNDQQQGNDFIYTDTLITEADFPTNISALNGYRFKEWDMTVEQINAELTAGKNVTVNAVFEPITNNLTETI